MTSDLGPGGGSTSRLPSAGGQASQPSVRAAGGWLCLAVLAALLLLARAPLPAMAQGPAAQGRVVPPVLDFPEPGLDDPAAYEGYRTRFYRDVAGNTVQVYLNGRDGRVVVVWADSANESVGLTIRDAAGHPVAAEWGGADTRVGEARGERWIELELAVPAESARVGLFALGTMRFERDIQYQGLHRGPLDARLRVPELVTAADALGRLPMTERTRHLEILGAAREVALRSRLEPALDLTRAGDRWRFRARQGSFDGRGRLSLDVSVDAGALDATLAGRILTLAPAGPGPASITMRVTTTAGALQPLGREEIFTPELLAFIDAQAGDDDGGARHRRLERQVRSAELLSSREKLMAGLPNFATYFGRDMLMTALMMREIWTPGMSEHVIASALGKLGPDGGVSHEEAVGGQAVREAAAEYAGLVTEALALPPGDPARARRLADARAVLSTMAATRENHRMLDDDFQLPVVVAAWLADPRIPAARKRAFLLEPAGPGAPDRLSLLVRNLGLVAARTADYAADPIPTRLVAFPRNDDGRWFSGSWRDSGPGYGNGTYALDVNAIWAPAALAATARILEGLRAMGLGAELDRAAAAAAPALAGYVAEPERLVDAIDTWHGAAAHFMVRLAPAEAEAAVRDRLAALSSAEAAYWEGARATLARPTSFPALSLDSLGAPIPIPSTDPAMALFLGDPASSGDGGWAVEALDVILTPYPAGLLVEGVGPVVSSDVYAPAAVRAAFDADPYHSPRTVWGREANLLLLGLAHRVAEAGAAAEATMDARVIERSRRLEARLRGALGGLRAAVEASGLKHHELWSYRVGPDGVHPVRYGTSTDVQLWNVTDLAVQYALRVLEPPSS